MTVPARLQLSVAIVICSIAVAHAQIETYQWTKISQTGGPSVKEHATGYDANRNQLIIFGGKPFNNDLWLFNLTSQTWRKANVTTAPAARFSMVYGMDQTAGRDRFIISTGEGQGKKFFNDIWAFDLASETWTELPRAGDYMDVRYGAAGGSWFADSRHFIVSHGFKGGTDRFDDAFSYDFNTQRWTEITPGDCPFARCLVGSAVVDSSALVMFGGCGSGGFGPCPAQDSWELKVQADASSSPSRSVSHWDQKQTCPLPVVRPSMTIAPGNPAGNIVQNVVLFGGAGKQFGNPGRGDIGVLDRTSGKWSLYTVSGTAGEVPGSPIEGSTMAYINSNATALTETDYVLMYASGSLWRLDANASATRNTNACPWVFDYRLFHGVTMFLSWGFFLPIGATAARFGKHWPNALWWKIHRPMQCGGVLLGIGGFIVAVFFMVGVGKMTSIAHPQIGIVVTVLGVLQPVNAFFRPHVHDGHKTRGRIVWEYIHKYSGRIALILGMIQPFQGLQFIRAHDALRALYAIWFAVFWSFYIIMTFMGKPANSPVAKTLNSFVKRVHCTKPPNKVAHSNTELV